MLKNFNCKEIVLMLVIPVGLFVRNVCNISCLNDLIDLLSKNGFFVLSCAITLMAIVKHSSDKLDEKYSPQSYAKLQSEKATYSFLGSFTSLMVFLYTVQSDSDKFGAFLFSMDILLIWSITCRHVTYAIYMQEDHRDKNKRICPFSQAEESCCENTEPPKNELSKKNNGNNVQIICNPDKEHPMQVTTQNNSENKLYDASKVFISLFIK